MLPPIPLCKVSTWWVMRLKHRGISWLKGLRRASISSWTCLMPLSRSRLMEQRVRLLPTTLLPGATSLRRHRASTRYDGCGKRPEIRSRVPINLVECQFIEHVTCGSALLAACDVTCSINRLHDNELKQATSVLCCHPERSEGSVSMGTEMLRCPQH